jgi:hypothetical protein
MTAGLLWGAAGCGVLNPNLLGAVGANTAASVVGTEGNIAILVMNQTPVTIQVNLQITKTNGGVVNLNIPVQPNDHEAVVQSCEVDVVQILQASYAGAAGSVVVPATVSPLQVGLNLQCGGVVSITMTGAPPNVFLAVQGLGP